MKAKFLFLFLALALFGEIVWAIFYLTNPFKFFSPKPTPSPQIQRGAILFLDPSFSTVKKGEGFEVNIVLDSQDNFVSGVDVILRFNPHLLTVVDADPKTEGIQITPGKIFSRYLGNKVDLARGRITISGVAEIKKPFSGRGVLAKIKFLPISLGKTKVFFEFQPARTNDSNVAGISARDILDKTEGGEYSIKER